jgi:hypothetical protein
VTRNCSCRGPAPVNISALLKTEKFKADHAIKVVCKAACAKPSCHCSDSVMFNKDTGFERSADDGT